MVRRWQGGGQEVVKRRLGDGREEVGGGERWSGDGRKTVGRWSGGGPEVIGRWSGGGKGMTKGCSL